jgi:D-alanine-D-alanine ligase
MVYKISSMRRYHVALIYNSAAAAAPEAPEDRGGTDDLRKFIRQMARVLRKIGYQVTVVPLANDLLAFQRRLSRLRPDVVFNQYDDVVHGAFYEMRVAALIQMMGYPMTGSPALALGLGRYKYMCSSLLHGAGIPIPPNTVLLERLGDIDGRTWEFPMIVQPSHEHAGVGLDRASVVHTKKALRAKVREVLQTYLQPALAQRFLPGREFNVGIIGGRKVTVLPLAEVDYSRLPSDIPPIMSYAAKWLENTVEFKKTRVICPAQVQPELARDISSIALRAFRTVGGWGYGRVDIRLDENNRPHVLDVNCNASLEEGVALARSAEKAGIDYPHMLQLIIRIALEGPSFDVGVPMLGRAHGAVPS